MSSRARAQFSTARRNELARERGFVSYAQQRRYGRGIDRAANQHRSRVGPGRIGPQGGDEVFQLHGGAAGENADHASAGERVADT